MPEYKIVLYNTEGIDTSIEEKVLSEKKCHNYRLVRIDSDNDEDFLKEAEDADGVIIVYTNMNNSVFKRLKKCQVVTTHTIGVNNIDLKAATENGICIGNAPDYCVEEVAVHTVALALDCARRISFLDRRVRAGEWDIMPAGKIFRTSGKTYGLVSFGKIPRRVSELLKPFGFKIIAYAPSVEDEILKQKGVGRAETIEDLFAESDFISVHAPLSTANYHFIGKKQFDVVKEGAIIIATGRGGVIDEGALKEAIQKGRVVAAGIDVIEDETTHKTVLMGMDEVVMTPHSAYYSENACDEVRVKAMEQILEVLEQKKAPKYLLNKDVIANARFLRNNNQD